MLASLLNWPAHYFEYVSATGVNPPAWVFVVAVFVGILAAMSVANFAISDMDLNSVLGVFTSYVVAVLIGSAAGMLVGLILWMTLPAALLCMVLAGIPTAIHVYRSRRRTHK